MAKKTMSLSFKNATIDKSDNTIVEYAKDEVFVYSIENIINEWSGIEGLSITIKSESIIDSIDSDSENGDGGDSNEW